VPNPHPTPGPKWLPAVLGAVLGGVVGLSIIVLVIWCFHRRKSHKSVTSGTQSGGRVHSWINGVPKTDASVTTTEVEETRSPPLAGYYEVVGDSSYRYASPPEAGVVEAEAGTTRRPASSPRPVHVEADGTERYELHVLERGSPDAPVEIATSYQFPNHPETSLPFPRPLTLSLEPRGRKSNHVTITRSEIYDKWRRLRAITIRPTAEINRDQRGGTPS
jgi:hypothetical protein